MAKKTLQAVGDDCVTFDDNCYWVADNVKKFLSNFQPGQEVDITVKDEIVTFIKKSGYPTQPQTPKPTGPAPSYPQSPVTVPSVPKPPMPQTQVSIPSGTLKGDLDMLTAAIIKAWQLDVNEVKELAKQLKSF